MMTRPLLRSCLAAAVALAYANGDSLAQQPAPAAQQASPTFAVNAYVIEGLNPIGDKAQRVLSAYTGADMSFERLQQATAALEAALRDAGYSLYRVVLPPQEVKGTITLRVVRFTVGKVTLEGNQHFDAANIRASVPELREGTSPNLLTVGRQLAVVGDNPAKRTTLVVREGVGQDTIDLALRTQDSAPWALQLNASNTGSDTSGKDRITLSASHHNLWNRDHQASIAYTGSANNGDVKQYGLNYSMPFYGIGSTLGLSASKSNVTGDFAGFEIAGAGRALGVSFTYYLDPLGAYKSYVQANLDDKLFNGARFAGFLLSPDVRSRPVSLVYFGKYEADRLSATARAELAANISGGSGNDEVAYAPNDHKFTVLRLGGGVQWRFASDWLLSTRALVQGTGDRLISGEQFGLGGASTLRGLPERSLTGDNGVQLSLEGYTPQWLPGLRGVAFVDAGEVRRKERPFEPAATARASSAGLGVRYGWKDHVSITLDFGRVFSGPLKDEERVHALITLKL
jgi:hemolysin activation/secretion protein